LFAHFLKISNREDSLSLIFDTQTFFLCITLRYKLTKLLYYSEFEFVINNVKVEFTLALGRSFSAFKKVQFNDKIDMN